MATLRKNLDSVRAHTHTHIEGNGLLWKALRAAARGEVDRFRSGENVKALKAKLGRS